MPSKKTSCERVHQSIAGPAPDQVLEAIRAEYWLPQSDSLQPDSPKRTDAAPEQPQTKPQVKP